MSDAAPPAHKTITDLIAVMVALRTPITGCPWDLEQNFATIAPYTIEEAYEVADAIQRGDLADLKEELGDLLLQVVYHAQLAQEQDVFAFADVVHGITTKMIRRHPHVFGDAAARSAGAAKGMWETIKAAEKAEKSAERARLRAGSAPADLTRGTEGERVRPAGSAPGPAPSLLADVPVGMPALTRAVKLQDKAARVGFDWPSLAPVLDKLKEELAELEAEVAQHRGPTPTPPTSSRLAVDAGPAELRAPSPSIATSGRHSAGQSAAAIKEEFGDLLFVMANVARHLMIDPEDALRAANAKFTRRFGYVESRLAERGKTPAQSNLAEMDALWDEVRAKDKTAGR